MTAMQDPLPRHVFKYAGFRQAWIGRLLSGTASLAQGVTLGWQVYTLARVDHSIEASSFLVGMIGLAQFLPLLALTLLAGDAADRYNRRNILLAAGILQTIGSVGLLLESARPLPGLTTIFLLASFFGIARAFMRPTLAAITPQLVPFSLLPRAIAWNTLCFQFGMIAGPWIAGLLCAHSIVVSYAFSCVFWGISVLCFYRIKVPSNPPSSSESRLETILQGLRYVWTNKVVFGAISLDLFAGLLGGATALLPVYARDVLHIGADGFGLLRSGPAIGSASMAFFLSLRPLKRHAGRAMLWSFGVYGLAILVFALSKNVWLSMGALAVSGAADAISIFVRQSLVQIVTPDRMRGRVASVSSVFISASNELGEFESGVTARWMGPIGAVVFGGAGAVAVTLLWAKWFPALRKADRLVATDPEG